MRKKSLSTLGYIMEHLNIQTVSMSRAIHVDASLVSKWKSGDRTLSNRSIYFDDIIDYILDQSTKTMDHHLKQALTELYPQEKIETTKELEQLLRQALSNHQALSHSMQNQMLSVDTKTIPTLLFEESAGRRKAIANLLDYAEAMPTAGELTFIDSEEFFWLLEDPDFSKRFVKRMERLLHRGFHARFVIHYSPYKERFMRFFEACNVLIFHRNMDWYCYEYYDEAFLNLSFYILNHAVSLLGFSCNPTNCTTLVFTDTSVVLQHELLAKQVLTKCSPLFHTFDLAHIKDLLEDISHFRKKGAMYSFLPAPVFIAVRESLLKEVLLANKVDEKNMEHCLSINRELRRVTLPYFSKMKTAMEPIIFLFQIEELVKRATAKHFTSRSLTLIAGKTIRILPHQYAQELRELADTLRRHTNIQMILVSKRDGISLPAINCWCKQHTWMVQMNKDGFRMSDELSIIHAASTTLEHCIRKVPPQRRDRESVHQYLLDLADSQL